MKQISVNIMIFFTPVGLSKKSCFTPKPPKGGFLTLWFSVSPPRLRVAATAEQGLGDLGVDNKRRTFSTSPWEGGKKHFNSYFLLVIAETYKLLNEKA